jgi:prepilin-type N-terminal cleavage/methylation domain-containing protein
MKRFQKGFTLVEIIMVLGIASFITAAVFIAVSGAQRSARDTTRRADTQKMATAIEQWSANNNGALPSSADIASVTSAGSGYLDPGKFKDPKTGNTYRIIYGTNEAEARGQGFSTWPGNMWVIVDQSSQTYYLMTPLESGMYTYRP